jgi:4-amino-4-deoxy-L-arabinose transferase-like glycosyltransferase
MHDMPQASDALAYSDAARDILAYFPGTNAYYRPPGTSLLLAGTYKLFGTSIWVSQLFCVCLGTLNVLLTAHWAYLSLQSHRAAKLAGWLAAAYPPALLMTGQTYSQHLAVLLILGLGISLHHAWTSGRHRHWVSAGICLGFGILNRPSTFMFLGVLPLAFLWLLRRGSPTTAPTASTGRLRLFVGLLLSFCAAAAVAAPAVCHNANQGAGWTVSTNNERNLLLGNCPHTPHYKTSHLAQRKIEEHPPEIAAYLQEFTGSNDKAARDKMKRETLRYVVANPGITLWRTLSRVRSFWGFDYLMSRQIETHYGRGKMRLGALLLFEAGGYTLVMLLAFIGAMRSWSCLNLASRVFMPTLVLGYQLPYTLSFAAGTHHYPVIGLLFPLAALGVHEVMQRGAPSRLLRSSWLWFGLALFTFVQLEYAFHVLQFR